MDEAPCVSVDLEQFRRNAGRGHTSCAELYRHMETSTIHIPARFFVDWFRRYGLNYPWREPGVSPFSILVTEILLKQTRAPAVSKSWHRIISKYPKPSAFVKANRHSLVSDVRVLGFGNQRAVALKEASKYVIRVHAGRVPRDVQSLLAVPFLGSYSARAILCFAFSERTELLDTNVLRFVARFYGLEIKRDIRRNPDAWDIARSLLPRTRQLAREHNYGLLDFTAKICKSRKALCLECPLAPNCIRKTQP